MESKFDSLISITFEGNFDVASSSAVNDERAPVKRDKPVAHDDSFMSLYLSSFLNVTWGLTVRSNKGLELFFENAMLDNKGGLDHASVI